MTGNFDRRPVHFPAHSLSKKPLLLRSLRKRRSTNSCVLIFLARASTFAVSSMRRCIDIAGQQGGQILYLASGLTKIHIRRFHAILSQYLDDEVV